MYIHVHYVATFLGPQFLIFAILEIKAMKQQKFNK